MTHYLVVTPEYETVISILPDGTGPSEWGSDTLEIEAPTARQAKVEAVRQWRKDYRSYVHDQLANNCSPFTGLKVFNMDLSDEEFKAAASASVRHYHLKSIILQES